jgi:hypothetical protein
MAEMPPLFVGLRRRAYYMVGKRYTRVAITIFYLLKNISIFNVPRARVVQP